jgi:hypothetical protein
MGFRRDYNGPRSKEEGERMRRWALWALALLLLWLFACSRTPAGGPAGGAPAEGRADLRSYGWDDLSPFRRLLNEGEFESHEELRRATVYHLRLHVGEPLTEVTGELEVRYRNRGSSPLMGLPFLLFPNLIGGELVVSSVSVGEESVPPEYRQERCQLWVPLPRPLPPGEAVVARLEYRLRVPETTEAESAGLSYTDGVLSLGYAYPMIPAGAVPDRPLPVVYGDFVFNEASLYLLELSLPSDLVLAAPGVEMGRERSSDRTRLLLALGPARDLYLAMSPDFQLSQRQAGKILVRSFAPEGASEGGKLALDTAAAALAAYGELFGEYPYSSLTVAAVPFAAYGVEFPGMVVAARRLYDLVHTSGGVPAGVLLESTVAHEVAHQWFYASVGSDQLQEPWLDEALAQYAAWLYYRDRYGEAGAEGYRQSFRDRWNRVGGAEIPIGMPVRAYSPREYGAIVYGRGPLFLEALAERMGEQTFLGFLKGYCLQNEWKVVTGELFRQEAEAACACELGDLWAQWVTGTR